MDGQRPFSVLVVDDDPVCRRFVAEVLAGADCLVRTAVDAEDALHACADSVPDAVVLDVRLPGGGGSALLERLAMRTGSALRAVAMSGDVDAALDRRLRDAGFVAVLRKPMRAGDVLAALGLDADRTSASPTEATAADASDVDDAAGLATMGSPAALAGVRTLFATELPAQLDALATAQSIGDVAAVRDILHRLRAACGFCGTPRLLAAAESLSAAPLDRDRLAVVRNAAEAALARLRSRR